MDALYFRVSTDRQTTENQFEDLLQVAEKDGSQRDWETIRGRLLRCVQEEQLQSGRVAYRVRSEVVTELARDCVYVEQGRSSRAGARKRPLFEQMKRDAALRKFDRLLVWKVSRNSAMGRLLWAIQAWFAEMENGERSEAIRAGLARARTAGKRFGRPRAIFDYSDTVRLRQEGYSWRAISAKLGVGTGTARRAYHTLVNSA